MEIATLPIARESYLAALRPGDHVIVRGGFNVSTDPAKPEMRVLDVLRYAKVVALGGSAVRPEKPYDNIQVQIRRNQQAGQLSEIKKRVNSGQFISRH